MPLIIGLNGTDVKIVESIQFKHDQIIEALVDKMERLMVRLQQKIQAKTKGRVRESIRNPRAYVETGRITGALDVGGPPSTVAYKSGKAWDITQILEEGAKMHVIYPLTASGTQARDSLNRFAKGKRFGSDVLGFELNGKKAFAAYVFHPGVEAQHFIAESVNQMRKEFRDGLRETLNDVMSGLKR